MSAATANSSRDIASAKGRRPAGPGPAGAEDPEPPTAPGEPSGVVVVDIVMPEADGQRGQGAQGQGVDLSWLGQMAGRAGALLDASGEVRVRIVGDAEMAAAHQRWSGVAGTTDVLTFDMRQPVAPGAPAHPLDTDLLVCIDEASRQASLRGHELGKELLLYIIHGMLHCLGHDDHDQAAAAKMHAREDEVLTALGVGAVYGRGGAA